MHNDVIKNYSLHMGILTNHTPYHSPSVPPVPSPHHTHGMKDHLNSLSLEEGNIEEGGVKVDKLKEVHLSDETVIVISLGSVQFCKYMYNTKKQ